MAMEPWASRTGLRGGTLAAMTAAAVPMATRYTQPYSPTEKPGASSATRTPSGTDTHSGGRYRRHPSTAQPRANGHRVNVYASGDAFSWLMVTIVAHSSITSPANRAACCSARRRTHHSAPPYTLTTTPTLIAVGPALHTLISCAPSP